MLKFSIVNAWVWHVMALKKRGLIARASKVHLSDFMEMLKKELAEEWIKKNDKMKEEKRIAARKRKTEKQRERRHDEREKKRARGFNHERLSRDAQLASYLKQLSTPQ